jgi:hypothetical protein
MNPILLTVETSNIMVSIVGKRLRKKTPKVILRYDQKLRTT